MQPPTQTIDLTKRWLIIVAVMSATLMQVLDTTIVNVALPHMQGSLGASPDQISWTLTCYLVSSGIFMPLTGYMTDILGRKKYLLICISGFTVASALCGTAESLAQIIAFRLLQGIFGAGLVPLSQAIITDAYPTKDLGKAMAIWGIGVMLGPILGPTLGGYLTEVANWRWTFYINVPVGILAFLLASQVVPDTVKKSRAMDWTGLILISLGIGALQYFLDRGNQEDWFNALNIRIAAFMAVSGIVGFILYNLIVKNKQLVFNIRIFQNRNFTVAGLLVMIMGVGFFGSIVMQPLLLENLLNYPVLTAGLVMAPRGLTSMISMMLVGKLINKIDPRIFIIIGILLCSYGMHISTNYSLNIDMWSIMYPILLQGFGLGMIFAPLSVLAFSTLEPKERTEATGLFSLLRTIGSSIGIAITLTLLTRHAQIAWNTLGGNINQYNSALTSYLATQHLTINNPQAIAILANELATQSQMVSFVSVFHFIMWSFLAMLPFLLLFRYKKPENQDHNILHQE